MDRKMLIGLRIARNLAIVFFCILIQSATFALPNTEGIQVYQDYLLDDEKKQIVANDIDRFNNAENIWEVLRHEFTLPHYEENPAVQEKISWFLTHQNELLHTANRAAPYLYFILQQVRKRHLPVEYVLLPMIESGFNPFAYSSAGAAGMWQIMPGTASGYGIKQSWWYDGRRDIIASTRAALDHLVYLGSFFEGNWLLATAAYDTGEGNVLAAVRKNNLEGKPIDFWSLPLAQETRDYVPRLLALAAIISHPDKYLITFPQAKNAPYLAEVNLNAQIDLKHAALLAGLSLQKLRQLNPGYNHTATAPTGPFKLILPIENIPQFTENLTYSPLYKRFTWMNYAAKKGDNWQTVARQFNVSTDSLKKVNPLLASNLKPGTQLVVPRSVPPISESILKSIPERITTAKVSSINPEIYTQKYTLQPGDTLYMVRRGDDLNKIAKKFNSDVTLIRSVNQLSQTHLINEGEQLIIPTHMARSHQYVLSPGDTLYMVRKHDTIESIAAKFHVSIAELRLANLLSSNDVKEGDHLLVPTRV